MNSWWELGEGIGNLGSDLTSSLSGIECVFCEERGNFSTEHHAEKRKANGRKVLNFDTLRCGSCGGYVLVMWSVNEYGGSRDLHDYRVLPWPLGIRQGSKNWPETVTRFWRQAHNSLKSENFDAAAVMARSALQAVMREQQAKKGSLQSEIDDLTAKGVLPASLKEWAYELKELGNEAAHPASNSQQVDPEDVRDVIKFLDFLLEYTYDVPKQIQTYRNRRNQV